MKSGIFKAVASMSASILGALAILAGAPAANASIYDVKFSFHGFQDNSSETDLGTITVTGTIVTSCDTCVLNAGNISNYSFTWNGTLGGTQSGNFNGVAMGGPLSASGGNISFVDNPGGEIQFSFGSVIFGQFQDGTVGCGNLPTDDKCIVLLSSSGYTVGEASSLPFIVATQEGLSSVTSVPLPAALPLFATGLGALGLLGWRRKRRA